MLKKLFVVALLATLFFSCKSKQAFNYSEAIVAKERSLSAPITLEERNAADFIQPKNLIACLLLEKGWRN